MSVFDDLVGQDEVVAQLQQAVEAARGEHSHGFTHAWLFTGPPGSGRSVAAAAFAAALQCPDGGCGHCHSCHSVRVGSHPNIDVVTPSGLSISVHETREIVLRSSMAPGRGG